MDFILTGQKITPNWEQGFVLAGFASVEGQAIQGNQTYYRLRLLTRGDVRKRVGDGEQWVPEWVDQVKREALSLLGMELGGQEGREPRDSQEPARPGVPRNADRVEEPGVPEDVAVVRAPEEAPRRVEEPGVSSDVLLSNVPERAGRVVRPRVSRYVNITEVSEEDQVESQEKRSETAEITKQVQESETGEESGVSGEISEKEVFEGSALERPKKKWKHRQLDLEEQLYWQQNQGRDSEQPSQDQEQYLEPYIEGTEQRYQSIVKRKSLTGGLLSRRKSQGKYRLERKPSLRNRPEYSDQGTSSVAPLPSGAPRRSVAPRLSLALGSTEVHRPSFALRSPQAPRVSLVPRVPLGAQVASGTLMDDSSSWILEPELKSRRQTIRFSLGPKTSRRLSQRSAGPCAFNELAKLGDPDLLEMVEQEGRTAGWC